MQQTMYNNAAAVLCISVKCLSASELLQVKAAVRHDSRCQTIKQQPSITIHRHSLVNKLTANNIHITDMEDVHQSQENVNVCHNYKIPYIAECDRISTRLECLETDTL